MNILFLTLDQVESIEEYSIYTDLLRCFREHGHDVYVLTPYEQKTGKKTKLIHEENAHILHIETGNVTKAANLIQKGLAQVSIESIYIKAIKTYFSNVKFDLVMYSTPPITFAKAVDFVKKRDNAKTYLLLKDIFPQNAVDIGMLRTTGVKGVLYQYFRHKEKKLYEASDRIGCMSQANVDYVLAHNPEVSKDIVEICPNCIEVIDKSIDAETRRSIRKKYDISVDKKVFVYGGNLGKPQGIDFLIECLRSQKNNKNAFFLVVGDGTEYGKLDAFVRTENPENIRLMRRLPKEDYDTMVAACDVGMVFLDHRFTIPNFPSRLLSYMQAKVPVLACTDPNTDIGKVITEGGFGWWCESNDTAAFSAVVEKIETEDIAQMGQAEMQYLKENYSVEDAYETIVDGAFLDVKGSI